MSVMDIETAHTLNRLTIDFYARNAASFSATRERPWAGWRRCGELIKARFAGAWQLRVLDIGCGNLRFEDFLAESLSAKLEVWAIDNCPDLIGVTDGMHFLELDIVDSLLAGDPLLPDVPMCDLCCAFGVLHHVPGLEARMRLVAQMVERTKPGGLVMCTLWQFERDERLARKAAQTTREALGLHPELELEVGDWLMGWKDEQGSYRYCHSFDDPEICALMDCAEGHGARLLDSFSADGKSGDLNRYLVFEKER